MAHNFKTTVAHDDASSRDDRGVDPERHCAHPVSPPIAQGIKQSLSTTVLQLNLLSSFPWFILYILLTVTNLYCKIFYFTIIVFLLSRAL